jgi:hypothetical protein
MAVKVRSESDGSKALQSGLPTGLRLISFCQKALSEGLLSDMLTWTMRGH